MKYRNGSPYVAVIRLVIDVARCISEFPNYEVDVSKAHTLPCVQ